MHGLPDQPGDQVNLTHLFAESLRTQCVRGRGGRTVQVHPQEALLQQARELQASPVFEEARRRRPVAEHRLARLAQLGIHQALYFGRAKTLFQLCLVAAVANLTLLAATSNPLAVGGSRGLRGASGTPDALVSVSSLLFNFGLFSFITSHRVYLHQLTHARLPLVRSLTPSSRPGF